MLGCANQAGEDNRNVARMALLLAGLPETVPGTTVNRLCGSGADAVAIAARSVRAGEADLVVAGGVESMSRAPFVMAKATSAYARAVAMHDTTLGWRFVNPEMERRYGIDSMGETAENVAEERRRPARGPGRVRAALAGADGEGAGQRAGSPRRSSPVTVPGRAGRADGASSPTSTRAPTTLEALARLRPAFRAGGSVTAGNASGVNDGAAALLVASERAVAAATG